MNKKILSAVLSLFVMVSSVSAFAYSDCDSEAVQSLTELQVLDGYDDGTFKPDALISRAEFAKVISVINGVADLQSSDFPEIEFSDVDSNHWAYNYIAHCYDMEIIDGYDDGTFKPDENISLAEAVKICLEVTGYGSLVTEQSKNWYEPWIDLAFDKNIISTKDKDPNGKATRAEIADIVYQTINLPLRLLTGYKVIDGVMHPTYTIADGVGVPFESLLTRHLQEI